jgi:multiple sugar transport system substrate-binding protein
MSHKDCHQVVAIASSGDIADSAYRLSGTYFDKAARVGLNRTHRILVTRFIWLSCLRTNSIVPTLLWRMSMSTTISRRGFLYGTSTFLAGASLAKPTLSQQETVKLRILTSTPKALYDDLCGRYMKAHPNVRIEVDTPSPTYDDLTLRVFRSVITNDAPDIIFQGFNRIATISERNLAVPLESFIAGEADWNSLGYQPALQDMTKFLGKSYGLPFAISSPMMYFNAKLVEKAGGDPNALPTTWPEIIRLAKAIKAASPDVLGLQYAYIGHSGPGPGWHLS